MVLDTSLLNTQHYKVGIKGKVEQSRERSSAPLHYGVEGLEKGAFGSPSTTVANNNFVMINAVVSNNISCYQSSSISNHSVSRARRNVCEFFGAFYVKYWVTGIIKSRI